MSLTSQSKKFNLIISDKEKRLKISDISRVCQLFMGSYAFIKHDKDFNDNGERKTNHYHIVLFDTKRMRLSTLINQISSYLDINPFAISIEVCSDIVGSLQYLIHKNDKEKCQYNKNDIISNIDKDELETYLTSENKAISFDRLCGIINDSDTMLDVIQQIGLGYYHIYRNTIRDMWRVIREGNKS